MSFQLTPTDTPVKETTHTTCAPNSENGPRCYLEGAYSTSTFVLDAEIPKYRLPHAWPQPEPEKAGADSSEATRKLLATADSIIFSQRDEIRILEEALAESWHLIRELRERNECLEERYAMLEEYASSMTRAARRCV